MKRSWDSLMFMKRHLLKDIRCVHCTRTSNEVRFWKIYFWIPEQWFLSFVLWSLSLALYVQYIYWWARCCFVDLQHVKCCLSSPAAYKCITDQREQLEQMLPLVLGLILGLIIVITISVYHFHLKLTAQQQPQLPRDRSLYKNMWTSPRWRHAPFTFISGSPV